MIMNNEAWNKVTQTHDLFKKIIAPLKQHLGINFGYMIVFNDGSYYQVIEDLECLNKWVTNVESSHIFCARNVTTYFDEPYNFTIWPEEPTCKAMEIYKEYGMWNGVTVSKINKDYTELYWFTGGNTQNGWHKLFIRNKQLLSTFILSFNTRYKTTSAINNIPTSKEVFKFSQNFNKKFITSDYCKIEKDNIKELISCLKIDIHNYNFQDKIVNMRLSTREAEVLKKLSSGYTAKAIAESFNISPRTIRTHIESIKLKTNLHSKMELVKLFEKGTFK